MRVERFKNETEFNQAAIDLLIDSFKNGGDAPYGVMLSGGGTPMKAYAKIAVDPFPPAKGLSLLFSDERHVPEDSEENNYHNTLPMIRALGLTDDHVLRVETDHSLEEAARLYDQGLNEFFNEGATVPLGLLGMGADGHTASLFSPEDVERGRGRLAIPVIKDQKPDRISVTVDFLKRVERIVFLVFGPGKAEIVRNLLEDPLSIPAGQAIQGHPNVEVWTG